MASAEDPVSRTRRQLECYYRCVTHGTEFEPGDDCPECEEHEDYGIDPDDVDLDDDDLLGIPRY